MKKIVFSAVIVAMVSAVCSGAAFAIDPSAVMGLSPDQMMGLMQSEQDSNRFLLEAVKERNRQQQYEDENPFSGCLSLGEVVGGSIEEAKSLGRQLGGTNIQYIKTTSSRVWANIYRCKK